MRNALLVIVVALVSRLAAVEIRVASFNIGAHFADTYFDYSLGDPGTPDYESVKAILGRIDADVVALQEIHSVDLQGTPDDLDDLAAALGYPYLHVTPVTGAFDTSLRVVILSRFPFISTTNIGSPSGAKEMTRLHPVVKVDVPGTARDLVMVSAHLKAGTETSDRFRRAVEMKRLTGHLASTGLTNDDNFVILGDFNPSSINTTFSTLPSGLPSSYVLGGDITLPVTYSTNPLAYFSTPGAARLDPRQLDGSRSTFGTTAPNGPTLDLILVSPAIAGRLNASEVYNSALDVSNSAGLPKAGSPLASTTSATASDHYAVFADLELDSDSPNLDLTISAPSVSETSPEGSATAVVTLPAVRPVPVSVTISSDDPAATAVSSMSVIPAGTQTLVVPLRTARNFIADGQHSVTFTANASGYDPDNAVLQVEDADGPYTFTAPGQSVVENFSGFGGNYDPAPWSTTGGGGWKGSDDGSSALAGFRSYGSAADASLGFLPQGGSATAMASFVNQAAVPLTALRVSMDVEQWRAAFNGAADGISAELITANGTVPLPGLSCASNRTLPNGPVAGGAISTLTATAGGLAIPPGGAFQLRISFNAGSTAVPPPSDVFVNEFHYDNASTDVNEFVEIAVGPGFSGALSNISLVIYNGSNGQVLATHTLDSFVTGAVTPSGHRLFYKYIPGLQNDTEGFAVVSGESVSQFISYEGSFTATNGPATGMASVNIGVSQSGSDAAGTAALGLYGSGGVASDFTWKKFAGIAHSPGQPNDAQLFTLPVLQSQGLAIDNVTAVFLTDCDQDGVPDETDADDDNDSQSDADEIAFGTNPRDAGSRFTPVISRAAAPPHGLQLEFPGASGVSYTVEVSTMLGDWQNWTTVIGAGAPVVLPLPASQPRVFYRVKAALPP